jgi:hypothetical protein
MTPTKLLIGSAILLCAACRQQDRQKVKMQPLPDDAIFLDENTIAGIHFQSKAMVEPKGSRARLGWLNQSGASTSYSLPAGPARKRVVPRLHKAYWEKKTHTYFGYDLAAERSDTEGNCRVSIAPLTMSLADFGTVPDANHFRPIALQTYPGTQVVRSDETVSLLLLASPGRDIKVVDYIQVSCKEAPLLAAESAAKDAPPPRDISVRDIELHVVDPEISINGNHVDGIALHGRVTGPLVWFNIPGKGRFLLSLARYPGFAQDGTVAGRDLAFRNGGDHYNIHTSQPLFQSPQPWNLYVRSDPSRSADAGPAFGSADHPEGIQ